MCDIVGVGPICAATILGYTGNDTLVGGAGDDMIVGGSGNDEIITNSGDDTVYGGSDDDFINAFSGNNLLNGGTGDDTISGGDGDDSIYGNSGDDVLDGRGGADYMSGYSGDDVLRAGGGDTLSGGSGADSFLFEIVYADSTSVITDFEAGVDDIQFYGDEYTVYQGDALSQAVQVGDDVVITRQVYDAFEGAGATLELILEDTQLDDLSSSDFMDGLFYY